VAEALDTSEERVESGVLPEAFNALDRQGWSVLDLGPATPATVAFFASYPCRVGFADGLDRLAAMARQWPMDPTIAWYDLRELLPVDPERPWNLVLLWDLLDYMPGALLERFMERLRPGLAAGARLHGFVTTGPQTVPARPSPYQILARDTLYRWVDPATGRQAPPRYSPWHLQRHMPGVVQESSRQRRDARQEHLLRLSD
jgi:hypothetical protein